jgi:tetratricopeptide (TPR) repeat protein
MLGIFVSLVLLASAQRALANDEFSIDQAYQNAGQGLKEYKSGHYAQALDEYTRAYAIVRLPALAVHIARTNIKLGRFVVALRFYEEALTLGDGVGDPHVQARARAEAVTESSALRPRIPKIVIHPSGVATRAIKLQVDGIEIPADAYRTGWLVDPGAHQVTARLGALQQVRWVAVSEGEVRELHFAFPAAGVTDSQGLRSETTQPPITSLTRRIAWASLAIGGAGLLVWGTAGIVAWKKSDHLESLHCGARLPACPSNELDSYNRWKDAATVGFYTGAAALLTGATLYIAEPKQKKTRDSQGRVVPWLGIGSAGVEGQF